MRGLLHGAAMIVAGVVFGVSVAWATGSGWPNINKGSDATMTVTDTAQSVTSYSACVVTVYNNSATPVYTGFSSAVSTTTGIPICNTAPCESRRRSIDGTTAAMWLIVASGTLPGVVVQRGGCD